MRYPILSQEFLTKTVVDFLSGFLMTLALLTMALALSGDWLIVVIHVLKQYQLLPETVTADRSTISDFLEYYHLRDIQYFWLSAMISGYGIYFIMGGFLHWYYYRRQKDHPETWKCQPMRWLSPELELDEIKYGCTSLLMNNTWSALIACYIYNGGYSTVYYRIKDYGYMWWILQWPVIFIYQDYTTYWVHRWFHMPFLYTRFHKRHHRYKQPTAFSVTAIHPVEITFMQIVLVVPLFAFPVHWVSFYIIALYTYYHGIVTHSGINMKAHWWQPWQPDAIFHDNHHQYFHVNFGFNCFLWDKIHGTYRQPDKVYSEDIYYGKGKSMSELTQEELRKEIEERFTESRSAYNEGLNPYLLRDSVKSS